MWPCIVSCPCEGLGTHTHTHTHIYIPDIGIMVRVFANATGDLGSIPGRVIPKTQNMVYNTSLFNTLHYKVRIEGKVELSREGKSPPPSNKCPRYEIKQSNGEAPVMLELWGMQSNPSLPPLPCPFWSGVVPPDRILFVNQIGLYDILTMKTNNTLNWIVRDRTVWSFNCENKWQMCNWIFNDT